MGIEKPWKFKRPQETRPLPNNGTLCPFVCDLWSEGVNLAVCSLREKPDTHPLQLKDTVTYTDVKP